MQYQHTITPKINRSSNSLHEMIMYTITIVHSFGKKELVDYIRRYQSPMVYVLANSDNTAKMKF